ncbi:MAG: RNA 2',3'-cyclic phosphodiesterase [Peptococcia bacterium]
MRAFIGIDFAPEVKKEIFNLQQRLRKYALRGRWKHSDNFHLTLKFLDEISLTQQAQINEAMQKVCLGQKPFKLAVTSLGVFNGKEAIRVLWLGLTGDSFWS